MQVYHRFSWLFILCLLVSITALPAQPPRVATGHQLAEVSPASVGMSSGRLVRLDSLVQAAVDEAYLPGAVILVGRRGQLPYFKAFGDRRVDGDEDMQRDDLFRIASMTKPIVSVGIMMLYEEGHFQLDDPIAKWAPEFEQMQVIKEYHDGDNSFTTEPLARPLSFRHLLTHTSGIGYPFMSRVLQPLAREGKLIEGFTMDSVTLAMNMQRLSQMPLLHQPGERWTYGLSSDLLGYLIERISGQPLDEFLQQRIFVPLGMSDTHFYMSPDKAPRLVQAYFHGPNGRYQANPDPRGNFPYSGAQTYFSGGAGLVSTAMDYARFLQMLLNEGVYAGHRILNGETIALMTIDQLDGVKGGPSAFGLGFAIATPKDAARRHCSVGSYRWSGIFGTDFWVDPKEEMFAIIMTQVLPFQDKDVFFEKIHRGIYQSIRPE